MRVKHGGFKLENLKLALNFHISIKDRTLMGIATKDKNRRFGNLHTFSQVLGV